MCIVSKPKAPPAPERIPQPDPEPVVAPPPPEPTPQPARLSNEGPSKPATGNKTIKAKRRGKSALRIDLSLPAASDSGLNIPS